MTSTTRKTQTLAVQDLDLDVTYQGDLISKLFNPNHSYKIVQRTEDAYFQPCSLCDREQQARYRVTIVNTTTGATFFVGRVCLEKFGVTYDELDKSTVLLAVLARTWLAYKRRSGEVADFDSTREAVEDMHRWFLTLANQDIKPFKEAAGAVGRILADLARINDYRTDVSSLQILISIGYETQHRKAVLDDRIVALSHHPLLAPHERSEAAKVLGVEDAEWHQIRAVSETLRAIRGKSVPLKIKRVPAWDSSSPAEYHEALRAYADERLQNLTESENGRRPDEFLDVIRKLVQSLKSKGGFYELVFESSSLGSVQRLQLPASLRQSIESASGVFLMAAVPSSYLRYAKTTDTYHSVGAMQKAAQQDDGRDDKRPDTAPQERFYRAVVLYVPDYYLPSYGAWARYGGIKTGRKHLEDLTSELLSGS